MLTNRYEDDLRRKKDHAIERVGIFFNLGNLFNENLFSRN
jgi:hypothetical protein